jgi:hypothetical protein
MEAKLAELTEQLLAPVEEDTAEAVAA